MLLQRHLQVDQDFHKISLKLSRKPDPPSMLCQSSTSLAHDFLMDRGHQALCQHPHQPWVSIGVHQQDF
jgi:hypothetical protein